MSLRYEENGPEAVITPGGVFDTLAFQPEAQERKDVAPDVSQALGYVSCPQSSYEEGVVAPEVTGLNEPKLVEETTAVHGLGRFTRGVKRLFGKDEMAHQPAEKVLAGPNYELPAEELAALEQELVKTVRSQHGRGLTSVWVGPKSPYANVVRTHENQTFSKLHIPELFNQYEDESVFLLTVDTRKGQDRVVRATRMSSPHYSKEGQTEESDDVRIPMIQDMVAAGEFTNQEFKDYYEQRGIDLQRAVSVETNFRIGERAPRVYGFIPVADVAYLSMYRFATEGQGHEDLSRSCMFAHINQATISSLERTGVPSEPLMGNESLRTPAGEGTYDDDFKPVAMFNTPKVERKMRRLKAIAPKEMHL